MSIEGLFRTDRSRPELEVDAGLFEVLRLHRKRLERLLRAIMKLHGARMMKLDRDAFRGASRAWQDAKWVDQVKRGRGKGGLVEMAWMQGYDLYDVVRCGDGLLTEVRRWLVSERVGEDVWYGNESIP